MRFALEVSFEHQSGFAAGCDLQEVKPACFVNTLSLHEVFTLPRMDHRPLKCLFVVLEREKSCNQMAGVGRLPWFGMTDKLLCYFLI